jgi:glutamate N-acetyltransferase/amino-acid N-acetyltransferase
MTEGDSSTNDSVVLLANGACGNPPLRLGSKDAKAFFGAVREVCLELAKLIVLDGEGATKFVTITVKGARSATEANQAAKAVAISPLVKTALYGADPNWGRILMAVGNSGCRVDEFKAKVEAGGYLLYNGGKKVTWARKRLKEIFSKKEIVLSVDLGLGKGGATVYTCDMSEEFIRLNSRYTT